MSIKSKKNLLDKPISYRTVKEKSAEDEVSKLLKEAGERATKLQTSKNDIVVSVEPKMVASGGGSKKEELNEKIEKNIRNVNSVDDLLGAFSDMEANFSSVSDSDYYPDDAFKDAIPDSLNLEKMEIPEIDRENIKKEAEKSASEQYQVDKDKLMQNYEVQTKAQSDKINTLQSDSEQNKKSINRVYDDYKVGEENEAIKRGLARSSVALIQLDNIEEARAVALSREAEGLSSEINKIESQIVSLQETLESSLENLDLELAEKVNSQIEKNVKALEQKQQEAIKFNNNVEKLQNEYKLKVANGDKTVSAIEKQLQEKYQGAKDFDMNNRKMDMALKFFNTMSKADALRAIISSPELATSLGDKYYELYYYFLRK